jgi:hypothetical protein
MSLCLHCPDVPGDRCRPSTADRTAHVLSAEQKHVTSQASICVTYSYGTCSALDLFREVIQAPWQVNVTAINRAQYSNITVKGSWSLLSSCFCPTQSSLGLTSERDFLFQPHWTCEADRIMLLMFYLECEKESWGSRILRYCDSINYLDFDVCKQL